MDTRSLHTVPDVFLAAFRHYRDYPAFTSMGQTLTYGELDRYSAQLASYIQHHTQLKPGDRVAVQLVNILQYPVALYGVLRAGMVLVNMNPLYTEREVEHQLKDSGAKALVVMSSVASIAAAVIRNTEVEQVIVTEGMDLQPEPGQLAANSASGGTKGEVPPFFFPQQIAFCKALSLGKQAVPLDVTPTPEAVAVLQYTGGTTGVAKGVMLTHKNLVANMRQMYQRLSRNITPAKEIFVAPLPLYHIYGFTLHCMMLASTGNHSILIPNPRDLDSLVAAIKPFRFTGFVGLHTLFNSLCHHEGFKQLDFSKLKTTTSGGMALTKTVSDLWESTTGCQAADGYGMTETSPIISSNPLDNIRIGTVGIPVENTEVKVVDERGNDLPGGGVGELWVRGPQVMKGYWQRPEATAEVLTEDGWLKTGDIGVIDDTGCIKIVDRKKDVIIVSGFNVYPNEIEDEVCKHPGVFEAAAISVPDDKAGEAVKLIVVKADPDLSREEIITFCRQHMTAYKVPRLIEFREELPKSNVGKILRRELKAKGSKGEDQVA